MMIGQTSEYVCSRDRKPEIEFAHEPGILNKSLHMSQEKLKQVYTLYKKTAEKLTLSKPV